MRASLVFLALARAEVGDDFERLSRLPEVVAATATNNEESDYDYEDTISIPVSPQLSRDDENCFSRLCFGLDAQSEELSDGQFATCGDMWKRGITCLDLAGTPQASGLAGDFNCEGGCQGCCVRSSRQQQQRESRRMVQMISIPILRGDLPLVNSITFFVTPPTSPPPPSEPPPLPPSPPPLSPPPSTPPLPPYAATLKPLEPRAHTHTHTHTRMQPAHSSLSSRRHRCRTARRPAAPRRPRTTRKTKKMRTTPPRCWRPVAGSAVESA